MKWRSAVHIDDGAGHPHRLMNVLLCVCMSLSMLINLIYFISFSLIVLFHVTIDYTKYTLLLLNTQCKLLIQLKNRIHEPSPILATDLTSDKLRRP